MFKITTITFRIINQDYYNIRINVSVRVYNNKVTVTEYIFARNNNVMVKSTGARVTESSINNDVKYSGEKERGLLVV